MTAAVRQLLESFDALTETEKQEAIAEVLRRATDLTPAALSDEELVEAADELFLALDACKAQDAQP
jgi:hypothetical protein